MSSEKERGRALEELAAAIRACTRCPLHRGRMHAVPGEGDPRARMLLVGEAPGRDEDASGRPFVGRAGRILDAALQSAHLPRESVFITNVVKCRPPGNRRPRPDEVAACHDYLRGQIACVRPEVIVTLGATALRALVGTGPELRAVHGRRLQLGERALVATYHPAGILYNRTLEARLRGDLRKAARLLGPPSASSRRPRASGRSSLRGRRATR